MTEEEQKAIENIEKELNKKYEVVPLYKDFSINSPMNIVQKHYNDTDLKIILNLISKLQSDIEIKDKVIEEIKSKLQKHINFCEQESRGHLENKVCHISLKFEKNLLEEVEKVGK